MSCTCWWATARPRTSGCRWWPGMRPAATWPGPGPRFTSIGARSRACCWDWAAAPWCRCAARGRAAPAAPAAAARGAPAAAGPGVAGAAGAPGGGAARVGGLGRQWRLGRRRPWCPVQLRGRLQFKLPDVPQVRDAVRLDLSRWLLLDDVSAIPGLRAQRNVGAVERRVRDRLLVRTKLLPWQRLRPQRLQLLPVEPVARWRRTHPGRVRAAQ